MKNLKPREKIILGIGGVFLLGYLFAVNIGNPLYKKQLQLENQIESKIFLLTKYYEVVNRKEYYQEKKEANRQLSAQLAQWFLSPKQPSLAAASLQKSVEKKARQTRVNIVQVKPQKTRPVEGLLGVPVRITVKSALKELTRFIREVENDTTFLVVDTLAVRRINNKDPELLETDLLILGFIQQQESETKETE